MVVADTAHFVHRRTVSEALGGVDASHSYYGVVQHKPIPLLCQIVFTIIRFFELRAGFPEYGSINIWWARSMPIDT